MPVLILKGHQETFAASQLLRLFYGEPITISDYCVTSGSDPLTGTSEVTSLAASGQTQATVRVSTRFGLFSEQKTVPARQMKREIGRQLYGAFARDTGVFYPWGALTGIRPTVIAAEYLDQSMPADAVILKLTTDWYVSMEKAKLCVETAQAEQRVLATLPADASLLYIGVPFCPSRCDYCSFITRDAPKQANQLDDYVDAILRETEVFFDRSTLPISALYMGGGTPTSLSASQLDRLFQGLFERIKCLPDVEKTIEAGRPDTIDREKLTLLKEIGMTRLCINPQTFHDQTLARIGRRHTVQQTYDAYALARTVGFKHINMDLIAGLPGETTDDFLQSLDQALHLKPESLTLHTLTLKRSARLFETSQPESGQALRPDVAQMHTEASRLFEQTDYRPYYLYRQKRTAGGFENVGYARPGCESAYNVGMMSDRRSVIGIGSGSASKNATSRCVRRLTNPREIKTYLDRHEELAEKKRHLFTLDAT